MLTAINIRNLLALGCSGLGFCGGSEFPSMVPGTPVMTWVGLLVLGFSHCGI